MEPSLSPSGFQIGRDIAVPIMKGGQSDVAILQCAGAGFDRTIGNRLWISKELEQTFNIYSSLKHHPHSSLVGNLDIPGMVECEVAE